MYHKAENWLELHNWAKLFMKSQLVTLWFDDIWTAHHMFFLRISNPELWIFEPLKLFWRKKHQQINKHYLLLLVKYLCIGIRNWNFLKILSFHHMSTTNPEFWIYQFFEQFFYGVDWDKNWQKRPIWSPSWNEMKKIGRFRIQD